MFDMTSLKVSLLMFRDDEEHGGGKRQCCDRGVLNGGMECLDVWIMGV